MARLDESGIARQRPRLPEVTAGERTEERRIETEVRNRCRAWMESAGVAEQMIHTQILFELPSDFVERYQALFELALDDGTGGKGKLAEEKGQVGVRPTESKRRGTKRGLGTGLNGSKGYKAPKTGGLRDDEWLEVKRRVDRKLVVLVDQVLRKMMEERRIKSKLESGEGQVELVEASQGSIPGQSGLEKRDAVGEGERAIVYMRNGNHQRICGTCGKIMKREYVMCPYQHL